MQIIPLSEGSFTIDKSKIFVPFRENTDNLQERPAGSLLVEIQPFIVVTSRDVLLLDTGLGYAGGDGEMQLIKNIRAAGIQPGGITKVLMTHLHKDHAGGVSDAADRKRLTFPEATYYVQEREYEFAVRKGAPSFIPDELTALKEAPNVHWLQEDEGVIDGYIHYLLSGAHSPCHQVFRIEEEGEIVFFGGDEAPQLQQMKHRFVAKYDDNGKKAMELRQQWWEQGARQGWTFLFYHDIKDPVFHFDTPV
ncbi:MAG TPA: MBL fold metallo-hydrolase [Chitinophagaceae bacterium]|nr:MBL fold metallo-hydrolase [Chitinophagaceae bacterium]